MTAAPSPVRSQINEKEYRDSLEKIQEALRLNPANAQLHYGLGRLYLQGGEGMKAIGSLRQALQLDGGLEEAVLALATIFFQCRQDDQASNLLTTFLETAPDSLPAIKLLCRVRIRQSDFVDSLMLARKFAELAPDDSYGHYLLGLAFDGLGQPQKATEALETSLQLYPDFADAHLQLGFIYSRDAATFLKAREHLQRAIGLGLGDPEVRSQLGLVLLKLGQPQDAIEELRRALQEDPDLAKIYYLLADAYRTLGRVQEATEALQRFRSLREAAVEIRGADHESQASAEEHYEEGMDRLFEQGPDEAYPSFLEALEINPQMHLAMYRLAQIDFLRGDVRQAENRIRLALQVYGLDPEYYFLLSKCLEQSNPAGSLQAIERAIDLNPGIADFHNLRANLLFSKGDYRASIEAYRQAISLDAEDPIPHLNLAAALRMVGATEQAKTEKEIYQRLNSERKQRE